MTWILLLVIVALLVAVATVALWWRRREPPRPRSAPPRSRARAPATGPLPGPHATISLDVDIADPDNPAVGRLVREAAARVMKTSPDVEQVIVEDRSGRRLGTVERHQPPLGPAPAASEGPQQIRSPQQRARGSKRERRPSAGLPEPDPTSDRSFADRFDLPDVVRARLRSPDDPVDVVRAILEASDLPVEVQENVLRCGNEAVIVVREGETSATDALTRAFLRFQQSGASQGVAIYLGYVDPRQIERRQALAPNLHYTGSDAVQRMADAVAVGGNPLRFAIDSFGA